MFKSSPCLIVALMSVIAVAVSPLAADEPDKELLRSLLQPPADKPEAAEPTAPAQTPATTPGAAPVVESAPAGELTPTQQQLWNLHWHNSAIYYAEVDGDYFLCSKWDPRYPSSFTTSANPPRRMTPAQWQSVNTITKTETVGGLVRDKKFTPSSEEANAAVMAIPNLAPNEYGYIHSAKVVEVKSPLEMIVDEVQLIDADKLNAELKQIETRGQRIIAAQNERERIERQRERDRSRYSNSNSSDRDRYDSSNNELSTSDVREAIEARYGQRLELAKKQGRFSRVQLRLIGYPTTGATVGQRWSGYDPRGVHIAVVDDAATKADKPKRRSRNTQLVAVNADMLRKGLDEQQFTNLLAARGLTRADFVELVREQLKAHTGSLQDTQPYILAALEQARAEHDEQQPETAEPGDRKDGESSGGSSFFEKKYGDKKTDGDKPAAESKEKDTRSFFEKKYGSKKTDGETADRESKVKDAKSFFEKKYGDKSKEDGKSDEVEKSDEK